MHVSPLTENFFQKDTVRDLKKKTFQIWLYVLVYHNRWSRADVGSVSTQLIILNPFKQMVVLPYITAVNLKVSKTDSADDLTQTYSDHEQERLGIV